MINSQHLTRFFTSFLLLAGFSALSFAQSDAALKDANNQFQLGPRVMHEHYAETIQDNGATLDLDREIGNVAPGVFFLAKKTFGNIYSSLELDYSRGIFTHQEPVQHLADSNAHHVVGDAILRLGYQFAIAEPSLLATPYLTFGYRYWNRQVPSITCALQGDGKSYCYNGFREIYHHGFYGGGLMLQRAMGDRTVLSLDASLARTFGAVMETDVAGVATGSINGIPVDSYFGKFLLKSRMRLSVDAGVDYRMTPTLHVNAGLGYRDFRYGASDIDAYNIYEPDSRTQEYYATVGVGFLFSTI